MRTVRLGTFETNSSSCHVLTLMSSADKENLLNHNAILYFSGHAGPEEDMLAHVLTHDEFVQQFFNDIRKHLSRKFLNSSGKILLQKQITILNNFTHQTVINIVNTNTRNCQNGMNLLNLTSSTWSNVS